MLILWSSFISQYFPPVGGEFMELNEWIRGLVILFSWKDHFIRVSGKIVQLPSSYISIDIKIIITKITIHKKRSAKNMIERKKS